MTFYLNYFFSYVQSGNPKDRRCLLIIGKPVDELVVAIVRDVLNNSNFRYCRFVAGCGFESYNVEELENELCKIISAKYEVGLSICVSEFLFTYLLV